MPSPGTTSTGFEPPRRAAFVTTHWSVVLSAQEKASPQSRAALEKLCRTCWYPLYAYVRRYGHSPEDAQDLTQEFFARLLQQNWLARADREKGRFRSFLLMAMKRFLAKEWDKARTLKRGGHIRLIPFPFDTAETRYAQEPAATSTPEQVFEKQWALALLEVVLGRVRKEYADSGRDELFVGLKDTLTGGRSEIPYRELAARLGLSEGAVKVAAHRLRQQYRERLREEIASTVAGPEEVEEELKLLFAALSP